MKYCVIKNTTTVIAQNTNEEKLIENALSTKLNGVQLQIGDFEIITEQEYETRKESEPIPPQEPTEIEKLKERLAIAEQVAFEASITQQELLEFLIESEVI